jgi:malonyl-CoA O-methyltransferase
MINTPTASVAADTATVLHQRSDIDTLALQGFNQRFAQQEPFIWQEAQSRLHSRLDLLTVQPLRILNGAVRAGSGTQALVQRYPKAQVYPLQIPNDFASKTLQQVRRFLRRSVATVTHTATPSTHDYYDLIVCNLALTWAMNPVAQLREWANLLAPGGVLLFSALGPDTARSLRLATQQAGWTTPIAPAFVDMHDYGDMMVQAGLTTPVMDVERVRLTYQNALRLKQDSAGLMGNVHPQRLAGLAGRARFSRLENLLNTQAAQQHLVLELELVFGHAWKPLQAPPANSNSNISTFSLDSLKATLPSQQAM